MLLSRSSALSCSLAAVAFQCCTEVIDLDEQLSRSCFGPFRVHTDYSPWASFVVTLPKEDGFLLEMFAGMNGEEEAERSIEV